MKLDSKNNFIELEEVESPLSLSFVESANKRSLEWLTNSKFHKQNYTNLLNILTDKNKPAILTNLFDGYYYNFHRDSMSPRGVLRRSPLQQFGQWETIIDFNLQPEPWTFARIIFSVFNPQKCLVFMSEGGKDACICKEFDLNSKTFISNGFELPLGKGNASWLNSDQIIFDRGKKSKAGYPLQLFLFSRGEELGSAKLIFEADDSHNGCWPYSILDTKNNKTLTLFADVVHFYNNEYYVYSNNKTQKLNTPKGSEFLFYQDDKIYFCLDEDAAGLKKGSIIQFNSTDFKNYMVFWTPDEDMVVDSFGCNQNTLFISHLSSCQYKIKALQIENGQITNEFNYPQAEGTSASIYGVDRITNEVLVIENSFIKPSSVYKWETNKTLLWEGANYFNNTEITTEQFFAKSKDGTLIPYFVVKNKNINKPTKTLLHGYGGFRIPYTPNYRPSIGKSWIEKGNCYVVANIRGGSEFGDHWHSSVLKMNRKKCYEDFYAVTQDLIDRKITTKEQLAISGGSNGGLLVGATMALYPDCCQAVICDVPLLDMERYHLLLAGHSWASEYGTVEDSTEMKDYILSYSPFHNVKPGVKYPRVLFTTSTYDDRVHPGHARKMYAKMKDQGHDVWYYEEKEGGHGAQLRPERNARNQALVFSFLDETLKD